MRQLWNGVQILLGLTVMLGVLWCIELVLWFCVLSPLYCLYKWFLA